VTRSRIWQWLSEVQREPYMGKLAMFGSTVGRKFDASDVDVLLITRRKNIRGDLRRLKRRFQRRFHKRLDVQIFHIAQVHEIIEFKRWCGPRKVVGRG
jgi:predicted nucleotidyltransferase